MKQYKIVFYHKRPTADTSVYYREFETLKELREWADDTLKSLVNYSHYCYMKIPLWVYIKNV